MNAKDSKKYTFDHLFWWVRVEYYRLKYEKLEKEDYYRVSRLVILEVVNLDVLWNTELDRVKCEAENIARILVDFSADKTLLKTEDYGNSIKNGDY